MAFNQAPSAASSNTHSNDSWKAAAFLNLYVRKADGSKAKVGAIALKKQRKFDAVLIDRLQQEDGVEKMLSVLEIDFQLADSGTPIDAGF